MSKVCLNVSMEDDLASPDLFVARRGWTREFKTMHSPERPRSCIERRDHVA